MALPTNGDHLSDQVTDEMIEQYGGAVDTQFAKKSIMRRVFPGMVKSLKGTDTYINRRVGRTKLKALTPGVRPDADATKFGRAGVTVDTVVLARDNRSMLNEFQTDFAARAELGRDHGKEMAKLFDESFLIHGIKGSLMPAPTGLNGAIGAGKNITLQAAGDELNPDKLATAIRSILTQMEEEDIELDELVAFVRPTSHEVLENHDKLTNKEFSGDNGNFALGTMGSIKGVPVLSTARIPQAAITNHLLSTAENGNAYDLSVTEAKAKVVILHPKSLLAAETIPLTQDVWFNREEKQWFIDTFAAYGVNNQRPDVCGAVFAA